jgi:hypothetical protein
VVASGVVVGDGLLLTSALRVSSGDVVKVGLNGVAADGRVRGVALGIFALIEAPTAGARPVRWGNVTALQQGQRLLALGFGPDVPGDPASSAGIFSTLRQDGAVKVVETDIKFSPGASGGPLFTQCGEVVGLTILPTATQDGRAIPSDAVQAFVRDLEVAPRLSTATPPASTSNTTPVADAAACGDGAAVTLVGASPAGHTYHAGDTLTIQFQYAGPGCKSSTVRLDGFHTGDSPMYQYWCVAPAPPQNTVAKCRGGKFVGSWAVSDEVPLTSGTITVVIPESKVLPSPGANVEPVEGFTVCEIVVGLDEARFPGHVYQQTFGAPCR